MSSYIVDWERLRAKLRDILRSKGKTVTDDATMATLVPLVNSIGINDEFKKLCEGSNFEIIDTEGIITSFIECLSSTAIAKITKISLPNCTSLAENTFKGATSLTEVTLPKCTSFPLRCLSTCSNLTSVNFSQNIGSIGGYFLEGSKITELHLGTVGTASTGFLNNCGNLIHFSAESISSFSFDGSTNANHSFYNARSLVIADFGDISSFTSGNQYTFYNATNFKAFVIRKTDGVATLGASAALSWLKSNVTGWHIYVPDALVDTYKAASNWSTYADYFAPLSDYDEETILNGGAE